MYFRVIVRREPSGPDLLDQPLVFVRDVPSDGVPDLMECVNNALGDDARLFHSVDYEPLSGGDAPLYLDAWEPFCGRVALMEMLNKAMRGGVRPYEEAVLVLRLKAVLWAADRRRDAALEICRRAAASHRRKGRA